MPLRWPIQNLSPCSSLAAISVHGRSIEKVDLPSKACVRSPSRLSPVSSSDVRPGSVAPMKMRNPGNSSPLLFLEKTVGCRRSNSTSQIEHAPSRACAVPLPHDPAIPLKRELLFFAGAGIRSGMLATDCPSAVHLLSPPAEHALQTRREKIVPKLAAGQEPQQPAAEARRPVGREGSKHTRLQLVDGQWSKRETAGHLAGQMPRSMVLIKDFLNPNVYKVQGNMVYDPKVKRWEGNNGDLLQLEHRIRMMQALGPDSPVPPLHPTAAITSEITTFDV